VALTATALGVGLAIAGVAAPANAATIATTYSTAGLYTFVVPVGITSIHVQALGGSGGGSWASQVGGAGALLTEDLAVTPGGHLFRSCCGQRYNCDRYSNGAGINGGGGAPNLGGGGGGGGASDLRLGADTLDARIVVAAEAVPGDAVVFTSTDTAQSFGPVTDNGDGSYSSVLTSSMTVHTATITATDTTSQSDPSGTIGITQTVVLATTGVDATPALGLATLLLVLGLGLMAIRRRNSWS
jgi:LPXTG-motif cell wall-anchored protein